MISVIRKQIFKKFNPLGKCNNNHLNEYKIIKELGRGASSIVYKMDDIKTKTSYTCKKIGIKKKSDALREIKILRKLKKREGFPQIYNVINDNNNISIVTRFINGEELFYWTVDRLRQTNNNISEHEIKDIFKKMVINTRNLHQVGFVHLDIKLENFLISKIEGEYNLTLIDFGSGHPYSKSLIKLSEIVGTRGYSPIEIYNGFYHETTDVWSLGICLWIFTTGNTPFYDREKLNIKKNKDIFKFPTLEHMSYQTDMSPELFELFCLIFKNNPTERINLDDILKSSWLK